MVFCIVWYILGIHISVTSDEARKVSIGLGKGGYSVKEMDVIVWEHLQSSWTFWSLVIFFRLPCEAF